MNPDRDKTRVVVTGMGTVNALASCVPDFAAALRRGDSGIGPVTLFDTSAFRTHTGGEVRGFAGPQAVPQGFRLKRASRADRMAFAAALEALKDARLYPFPEELRRDTGVGIGGGAGGMLEAEEVFRRHLFRGAGHAPFSRLSSLYCAATADLLTDRLGLAGPKAALMTACSSSATAIGLARDFVRDGLARVMLAGGTEPLCRITYSAFNALQAVDPLHCRPFDRRRRGLSLGEAAAFLVLESLPHARERGATIYGEVLGYGVTGDAHHMTAPDAEASGAIRAMTAALEDAGLPPEAVNYVNAHGTATPANDAMETKALKAVFGRRAYRIPASSTKSMTGHTLGASGALEAVVSLLAIRHAFLPPTIHLSEADPACDLDYVAQQARPARISVVLSNAFAFGGNNTTLVFGRYVPEGIAHA